jgi:hypothetical protein
LFPTVSNEEKGRIPFRHIKKELDFNNKNEVKDSNLNLAAISLITFSEDFL